MFDYYTESTEQTVECWHELNALSSNFLPPARLHLNTTNNQGPNDQQGSTTYFTTFQYTTNNQGPSD